MTRLFADLAEPGRRARHAEGQVPVHAAAGDGAEFVGLSNPAAPPLTFRARFGLLVTEHGYGLGNKGAAWLKRELALPFHQPDWKQNHQVGRLFLEHALLVSDIMVAIELACRNRNDIQLLSADDLKIPKMREPFQWQVDIGQRKKIGVIPDRVFGMESNGKQSWYCLEADRGTMPITRSNLDQTSFQRKLLAYEATWSQNLHRSRFGWQRFRVLTVTTSSERVRGINEACQGLPHGQGLFLFLDAATLAQYSDILSIPWHTCHNDIHDVLL